MHTDTRNPRNSSVRIRVHPWLTVLTFPQQLLNLRLDCRRRCRWSVTLDHVSFLVHQELGEVPLDAVAEQAALFAFQKLEDRMRILAVDLDFREQWKAHAIVELAKRFDLGVGTGLLVT